MVGGSLAAINQLSRTWVETALGGRREPDESVFAWLRRLGWLTVDADRVQITTLGRAVLAAVEEAGREEELAAAEIVLAPTDPLAYARVIGAIAEAGAAAALVDPYFSIDVLLDVVQRTGVERVLTGPRPEARLAALGTAVTAYQFNAPFEVRITDEIHDRLVIPVSGPVRFIGTSLGGVGRRLAVSGQMSDDAVSAALRVTFEQEWERAQVLARGTVSGENGEDETAEPSTEEATGPVG